MGLPLRADSVDGAKSDSTAKLGMAGAQGGAAGAVASHDALSVFEYGNLRPDLPDSTPLTSAGATPTRAWLLGSRLYSFTRGGVQQPAVRLEESGYAVLGYVMNPPSSNGIGGLLEETERRQYSPQLYERDVVEVVTESGNHVRCYVYHRPDVDQANPISTGDWRNRSNSGH